MKIVMKSEGFFRGKETPVVTFLLHHLSCYSISAEKGILFKVYKTLLKLMNSTLVKWLPDTSRYCCGVIFEKGIEVFSQSPYLKCFHYSSEVSGKSLNFIFVMIYICFLRNRPK